MRRFRFLALGTVVVLAAAGCTLTGKAVRYAPVSASAQAPFWCDPQGGTKLMPDACARLSIQLDEAVLFAEARFTAGQATAAGATSSAYQTGVGAAFRFSGSTAGFDPAHPDTLLYDGTGANAQVSGIEYNVAAAAAPEGFEGPNDVWADQGGGTFRLRVWMLRPFQDQTNVFADSHPCLASGGPVYDVSDTCYTSTHPGPLQILVSNDDGYDAPGIDAAVEALRALPNAVVTVSAPATNQSGSGSNSTPGPWTATTEATASGYPAWAVVGTPVDSVKYALQTQHVNPDLVVSGSNTGQNIGGAIPLSGTIGAAREGARNFIPAVAVSQGLGSPPDFPASVSALLAWLNDFLLGRAGRPGLEPVVNINAPTCTAGSIRGTVHVPPATTGYSSSDCTSVAPPGPDDVTAFAKGFITISTLSATSGSGT